MPETPHGDPNYIAFHVSQSAKESELISKQLDTMKEIMQSSVQELASKDDVAGNIEMLEVRGRTAVVPMKKGVERSMAAITMALYAMENMAVDSIFQTLSLNGHFLVNGKIVREPIIKGGPTEDFDSKYASQGGIIKENPVEQESEDGGPVKPEAPSKKKNILIADEAPPVKEFKIGKFVALFKDGKVADVGMVHGLESFKNCLQVINYKGSRESWNQFDCNHLTPEEYSEHADKLEQ